ncbi:MAG: tyrosine--tRNA ligase [Hyphomonadaceae bacterium]|nr:tyrosine--tRNA ligase [Hyphomonadaceae bacterium]
MTYSSDFLRRLETRGFIHQITDSAALDGAAGKGSPITAYVGFDCTAPSLHIGNLVSIMMLRHLQQAGHRPIVLMGGGTTKVGDPSDKNEARPVLSDAVIDANKASIKTVFAHYLTFGAGRTDAIMVDNADWLCQVKWLDMLRDIGRHFTINKMIALDIVKRRLDAELPITFLEFNYMLMQAYDFLELSRRHDCRLQMGGSDQWGNIVQGVELCRRADGYEALGLTQPLLMNAAGQKMGKSVHGAIWLNADMLAPFDYWQYWRNVDDADVTPLLARMTDIPMDEVRRLGALQGAEINQAKIVLANAITAMLHGQDAADAAAATAQAQFAGVGEAASLPEVTMAEAPASLNALFVAAGLVASNGEAKRQIAGGGLKVDDVVVNDANAPVPAALRQTGRVKLSLGKKKHVVVTLV